MRHQVGQRFPRPVHGAFLYHRHPVRNLRRGDHLPVPVGGSVSPVRLVWYRGSRRVSGDPGGRICLGVQEGCSRVGLTNRQRFCLLLFFPGLLTAAPKLRLSASTVGPVSIAQSANGATQTVEAFNIGDGSLSLALSSS